MHWWERNHYLALDERNCVVCAGRSYKIAKERAINCGVRSPKIIHASDRDSLEVLLTNKKPLTLWACLTK